MRASREVDRGRGNKDGRKGEEMRCSQRGVESGK
jgi:hypothetical protein